MLSRKGSAYLSSYHNMKRKNSHHKSETNNDNQLFQQHSNLNEQLFLEKLLVAPSKAHLDKNNVQNNKKYEQKFKKPDTETLIHQNNELKLEKLNDKKIITSLKLKTEQYQRKLKKLENINDEKLKNIEGEQKNVSVYTQILKKKIQELNLKYLSAEAQIKQLKKLPNISIYEENSIEKQYLFQQANRLRSKLKSYEAYQILRKQNKQNHMSQQHEFLKNLKQENQKLKTTIRELQNDKTMLKSRQIVQGKHVANLSKQIQQLKQKLIEKESQICKLNNENNNLLFKKTNQFRIEQQKRQNQQMKAMLIQIQQLKNQRKKLIEQQTQMQQYNNLLKDKQSKWERNLNVMQQTYQAKIKSFQDLVEQLQFQNNNFKNDYYNLLSTANENRKKRKSRIDMKGQEPYFVKPVKFQAIQLGLIIMRQTLIQTHSNIELLLFQEYKEQIKCFQLISLFQQPPFNINKQEATKLARYIIEDNNQDKVQYNLSAQIDIKLALTRIKAMLNKIQQSFDPSIIQHWKLLTQKSGRRMLKALEEKLSQGPHIISKSKFCQFLATQTRTRFDQKDIIFIVIRCFERQASTIQTMVNLKVVIESFQELIDSGTLKQKNH